MAGMKRRDFIALCGGAAISWPLAARAQQPARARSIGFVLPGGSRTTVVRAELEAFRQGLKEYGWIEGQNISIQYRFAEGKEDALAEIAAEMVRLQPGCHRGRRHSGNPSGKSCHADYPNRHGDEHRSGWKRLGREPSSAWRQRPARAFRRRNWPASGSSS